MMVFLKVVSAVNRSSGLQHLTLFINTHILCKMYTDDATEKNNDRNDNVKNNNEELLEEPTTCCMSGCQNCVWLEYAEKLTKLYGDKGEAALKEIEEKVTDPNIKAFLLHELRMRKPK